LTACGLGDFPVGGEFVEPVVDPAPAHARDGDQFGDGEAGIGREGQRGPQNGFRVFVVVCVFSAPAFVVVRVVACACLARFGGGREVRGCGGERVTGDGVEAGPVVGVVVDCAGYVGVGDEVGAGAGGVCVFG
jgi:hypothetical protein